MPKLDDYSQPKTDALPNGFKFPEQTPANFEFKPAFLNLLERNQFGGGPTEDPHRHIQTFVDYCSTIKQNGVEQDEIRILLFPFSLKDDARDWITDLDRAAYGIDSWQKMALVFYQQYYPVEKTNRLRSQMTGFRQNSNENLFDAWKRYKKLLRECPHHGLNNWLVILQFYNGLAESDRLLLDSTANGNFAGNTDEDKAWAIIEKTAMRSQQYSRHGGNSSNVQGSDSINVLTTHIAALTQQLGKLQGPIHSANAIGSQAEISCGACGGVGHTSLDCRVNHDQVNAFQAYNPGNQNPNLYNANMRNHPNFSWKSPNVLNPPAQQQVSYQKPYAPPGFQAQTYQQPPPPAQSNLEAMMQQMLNMQATQNAQITTQSAQINELMAHRKIVDTQIAQISAPRNQGCLPSKGQQPHETANAITLRSGTEYKGPEMPTDGFVEGLVEDDEDDEGEDWSNEEKSKNSENPTKTRSSNILPDRVNIPGLKNANTRPNKTLLDRVNSPEIEDLENATKTRSSNIIPDRVKFPASNNQQTRSSKHITDRVNGPEAENADFSPSEARLKGAETPNAVKLPYPSRQRKDTTDSQFNQFLEVLNGLKVSVPFMQLLLQIPSYAKFVKEILSRKRTLPSDVTVAFTQESSSLIEGRSVPKLCDPGSFSIPCTIGHLEFSSALCDLGASISIMPYSVYQKLNAGSLKSTLARVQLADRSVREPRGILEDMPMKIGKFWVPVDFMVMDIPEDAKIPIILGRPFLKTAGAVIDVKRGRMTLEIGDETVAFNMTETKDEPMIEETVDSADILSDADWYMSLLEDPFDTLLSVECAEIDKCRSKEKQPAVKDPVWGRKDPRRRTDPRWKSVCDMQDEDFENCGVMPVGFADAVYAYARNLFDPPGKGADGEP